MGKSIPCGAWNMSLTGTNFIHSCKHSPSCLQSHLPCLSWVLGVERWREVTSHHPLKGGGGVFSGKDAETTERVVTGIALTCSFICAIPINPHANPSGCFLLSSEEEKEARKGPIQDSHPYLSSPQISASHLALR